MNKFQLWVRGGVQRGGGEGWNGLVHVFARERLAELHCECRDHLPRHARLRRHPQDPQIMKYAYVILNIQIKYTAVQKLIINMIQKMCTANV